MASLISLFSLNILTFGAVHGDQISHSETNNLYLTMPPKRNAKGSSAGGKASVAEKVIINYRPLYLEYF